MPVPLDEYPIHQAPVSMRWFGTSDRNVYDRCIYQCSRRDGGVQLITGLGVYPHLGVIDAYATVRRGTTQTVLRMSDALGDDRMQQTVGPVRIDVVEPLSKVHLVCDGDEHGVAYDLTFDASVPPLDEPPHVIRNGDRVILDACRFAQTGLWSGVIRIDGEEIAVAPQDWVGSRDRSWGIRPVGEPENPGRPAEGEGGFWWVWMPLRFDDYSVMVIAQERTDGHRIHGEAVRMWPDGRVDQLGWPEFDIRYRSGTRWPEHVAIQLTERGGKPLTIELDTQGGIPLSIGCGYGGDPDWGHGQWRGRGWVERAAYDFADPAVAPRIPFGVIDHVARATCDGAEGFGIFEHASIGKHTPTGMADFTSMAP